MDISEFQDMWDGSEPGWVLHRVDQVEWQMEIVFRDTGPSLDDVRALHRLAPEFRASSIAAVYRLLKGRKSIALKWPMGNVEAHDFCEAARRAGLEVRQKTEQLGGYFPILIRNGVSYGCIIEDEEVAAAVVAKMIAAGVPVEDIHSD